jgi:hypothetical protein
VERGRTDGGLGGRVDYGEAATERRLPPPTADEQAPAGDLPRRRGHVLPRLCTEGLRRGGGADAALSTAIGRRVPAAQRKWQSGLVCCAGPDRTSTNFLIWTRAETGCGVVDEWLSRHVGLAIKSG